MPNLDGETIMKEFEIGVLVLAAIFFIVGLILLII